MCVLCEVMSDWTMQNHKVVVSQHARKVEPAFLQVTCMHHTVFHYMDLTGTLHAGGCASPSISTCHSYGDPLLCVSRDE